MTNKQKIKKLQEIINKYLDILRVLPIGGEVDEELAKKLGIPKNIKSFIDHSYRSGKLKGITKKKIKIEDMEKYLPELTISDNEFLKLAMDDSEQDFTLLLERKNVKLNKLAIETLKRESRLISTAFKDKPIPKRWMAEELRKIANDTSQDWDMVIRTELVNAQQEGMANAILEGESPYSNKKGETMVFKRPNPDACKHCKKHYLEKDQVIPKLFTLDQLIANGTNYGKKVQDWKPTLSVMHPHCQCQLQVMPEGCTFDRNGSIVIDRNDKR